MSYFGLGQALPDLPPDVPCSDPLCLFGLMPPSSSNATGYQCNTLETWLWPTTCASANSPTPPVPTLPNGGAPSVISVTGDGATITTPTAQQQQQINLSSIQAQAAANAPVDCTQWYNNWFNPACSCTYCQSILGWGAVGLIAMFAWGILRK